MRKYRRITYEDRCQIYALSKRGVSQESIAGVLGVSQSAVRFPLSALYEGTPGCRRPFHRKNRPADPEGRALV